MVFFFANRLIFFFFLQIVFCKSSDPDETWPAASDHTSRTAGARVCAWRVIIHAAKRLCRRRRPHRTPAKDTSRGEQYEKVREYNIIIYDIVKFFFFFFTSPCLRARAIRSIISGREPFCGRSAVNGRAKSSFSGGRGENPPDPPTAKNDSPGVT